MEVNLISFLYIYCSELAKCSLARTSLDTRGSASNIKCQVMCPGVRVRDVEKLRHSSEQLFFVISQLSDTALRVHQTHMVFVSSLLLPI
jgi:hypothetical protein